MENTSKSNDIFKYSRFIIYLFWVTVILCLIPVSYQSFNYIRNVKNDELTYRNIKKYFKNIEKETGWPIDKILFNTVVWNINSTENGNPILNYRNEFLRNSFGRGDTNTKYQQVQDSLGIIYIIKGARLNSYGKVTEPEITENLSKTLNMELLAGVKFEIKADNATYLKNILPKIKIRKQKVFNNDDILIYYVRSDKGKPLSNLRNEFIHNKNEKKNYKMLSQVASRIIRCVKNIR